MERSNEMAVIRWLFLSPANQTRYTFAELARLAGVPCPLQFFTLGALASSRPVRNGLNDRAGETPALPVVL